LAKLPPIREFEAEPIPMEDFTDGKSREVRIEKHDGVFFVEGEWLLKLLQTVDLQEPDSLQYFERVLQSSGVIDRLREAGVQEGDTVSIYDVEFDFMY
jgi:GTP-binding protein